MKKVFWLIIICAFALLIGNIFFIEGERDMAFWFRILSNLLIILSMSALLWNQMRKESADKKDPDS